MSTITSRLNGLHHYNIDYTQIFNKYELMMLRLVIYSSSM